MNRQEPRILEVNFDRIQKAMEDIARNPFDYYFDLQTGEVIALEENVFDQTLRSLYHGAPPDDLEGDILVDSEIDLSADLPDHLYDRIEEALAVIADTGRYIRIPERKHAEAFDCMKRFAEQVDHPLLRESLFGVLNGKKSFRKFKDTVAPYPDERKRWHAFNARRMREVIGAWLKAQGITPVRKRAG